MKRKVLGERIIKAIRFPVMNQQEFTDVVLDCDILTKKESIDLMKYFSCVLKLPMGFSEAARPGSLQRIKLSRFGSIPNCSLWCHSTDWSNTIVVSVDKTIKLHAVRLFGIKNYEFLVTLTVTDSNGVALATKAGRFMSQLVQSERGDYHGFDVPFEPPVTLQAGIQYSLDASICGPRSASKLCGSPRVELAGVTFLFADKTKEKLVLETTVSVGQFTELVFSVK